MQEGFVSAIELNHGVCEGTVEWLIGDWLRDPGPGLHHTLSADHYQVIDWLEGSWVVLRGRADDAAVREFCGVHLVVAQAGHELGEHAPQGSRVVELHLDRRVQTTRIVGRFGGLGHGSEVKHVLV